MLCSCARFWNLICIRFIFVQSSFSSIHTNTPFIPSIWSIFQRVLIIDVMLSVKSFFLPDISIFHANTHQTCLVLFLASHVLGTLFDFEYIFFSLATQHLLILRINYLPKWVMNGNPAPNMKIIIRKKSFRKFSCAIMKVLMLFNQIFQVFERKHMCVITKYLVFQFNGTHAHKFATNFCYNICSYVRTWISKKLSTNSNPLNGRKKVPFWLLNGVLIYIKWDYAVVFSSKMQWNYRLNHLKTKTLNWFYMQ